MSLGKITATKHANGRDWWILLRKLDSNKYYRILITPDAITNFGIQEVGESFTSGVGQAVFSPDGNKYAIYSAYHISEGNHLNTFDFDRCTGLLSNPIQTVLVDSAWSFGAAISPNSQYLYVPSYDYIYQYDLEAQNILASKDTVAIYDGYLEEVTPDILLPTHFYLM